MILVGGIILMLSIILDRAIHHHATPMILVPHMIEDRLWAAGIRRLPHMVGPGPRPATIMIGLCTLGNAQQVYAHPGSQITQGLY